MVKRALTVGINDYPGTQNDLNGCVNDANAWADLLIQKFGFPAANVQRLQNADATKAGMMKGLKWLLADSKAGDVLVFTNSSHGTYVADDSGDEDVDEALCPYDAATHLIIDDELRALFKTLPDGVSLTVIADNCHSGTGTRAAGDAIPLGAATPDDRRIRFLDPTAIGRKALADPGKAVANKKNSIPESSMKELLLSGCTASEYSYDARINGTYHGAMSAYALQAIAEANGAITWDKLHERLRYLLEEAGYAQHPQLEGRAQNKKKAIFT